MDEVNGVTVSMCMCYEARNAGLERAVGWDARSLACFFFSPTKVNVFALLCSSRVPGMYVLPASASPRVPFGRCRLAYSVRVLVKGAGVRHCQGKLGARVQRGRTWQAHGRAPWALRGNHGPLLLQAHGIHGLHGLHRAGTAGKRTPGSVLVPEPSPMPKAKPSQIMARDSTCRG